jgi:hypothetical protein
MEHITIHIDRLTNSIVEVATQTTFATTLLALTAVDKKYLKTGWSFDWLGEFGKPQRSVFKLVIDTEPTTIQGLLSFSDGGDHIIVNLVENAYFNIGQNKKYEGVGGNLFAFACKSSFEKGYDGFVSFLAKTNLVQHYEKALGAGRIGSSTRMIIETAAASNLVRQYFAA